MNGNVAWLLEADIKDRAALDAVMADLVKAVDDGEPGTLIYEWNISADGKTLINYERFASSDAAMAHVAGFGAVAGRFMEAVTPTRFVVFGDPAANVKEAIAAFGAQYTTFAAGVTR